jgi:hypothetical protein
MVEVHTTSTLYVFKHGFENEIIEKEEQCPRE